MATANLETEFSNDSFHLGQEVFVNCPHGMVHQTDECLLLLKWMCGSIQAVKHHFNLLSKILMKIGFKQSHADPCLFLFENVFGLMLVTVHVDDVGLACSSHALAAFLFNHMKKRNINCTVDHDITDHLIFEILIDKSRTKAWLGQPNLLKKILTLFAAKVFHLKNHAMPDTFGRTTSRPKEDDRVLELI